ncbi:MAG: IS200/IS605 family transposase [Candidatus Sungbacteria bacterium]|nr:IS200/IS605 family transposase [Candidatus Sungbacteria bacterium]
MGQKYRKSAHGLYDIKIHLVWITKYRYRVLTDRIALRLRDLVRQICSANDTTIISGTVAPNHIHILVSYPPNMSVSKLMQYIKGISSRKLQQEFPELGKRYWEQHLWARGFFAVSTGNVTTEMIDNYIKNHKDEEEEFKVGRS